MNDEIPIKIVLTYDKYRNKKISVMTDMAYALDTNDSAILRAVHETYIKVVEDCCRILAVNPRRPTVLRQVSLALAEFNSFIYDKCVIVNKIQALERDLKQNNIRTLLRMAELDEKFITDSATFTHYVELMRAQARLKAARKWEEEIEWFIHAANTKKLPKTREYRTHLADICRGY